MTGQPKLFGGSLEEYLEATGEEIPLIMRSCIRVINLYGNFYFKIALKRYTKRNPFDIFIFDDLNALCRSSSSGYFPSVWFAGGNFEFP